MHKLTLSLYALKKVKKDIVRENNLQEQFLKEVKVQSFFNHPNLVSLYGIFDDDEYVYLILEYMDDGSLDDKMMKRNYHTKNVNLFS